MLLSCKALKCSLTICQTCAACAQRKNWPRCRPLLRHAIQEDVPEGRRGLVRRGYTAWNLAAAGFGADWLTITMMCVHACSPSCSLC